MISKLIYKSRVRTTDKVLIISFRNFFGKQKELIVPKPAIHQLKPLHGEKGHFKYERYWSTNNNYVPQTKAGDTFSRALFGKLGQCYELFPFHFLATMYILVTLTAFYLTFQTIEFGNPKKKTWAQIRDKYWKYHTVFLDLLGVTHQRFPLMEQLLDEIEEAAEKRRLEDEARDEMIKAYGISEEHHH